MSDNFALIVFTTTTIFSLLTQKIWGQVFWDAFLSSYCCWDYGGQCVHFVLCLSISPRLTGLKFSIYSQGFSSATRQ